MAAGFKKATVRAADVPSTQTDFPSYVDLDRLGITTLAEAQSVRVYADSAKTTEWAREIVSATEMHVKVPSLTSTVDIYVDWDGVRSDYATTATYGRNAVWTDYAGVWHMQASSGSFVDSTGNGNSATNTGTLPNQVAGKIGKAQDYNGTSDKSIVAGDSTFDFSSGYTLSFWANADSFGNSSSSPSTAIGSGFVSGKYQFMIGNWSDWGPNNWGGGFYDGTWRTVSLDSFPATSTWFQTHMTYDNSSLKFFVDGANEDTLSYTGTISTDNPDIGFGCFLQGNGGRLFDSRLEEIRIKITADTANWITTEYNNQNAESTFWGTWTDVSTATTVTNIISIGNIVELNNISSIIGA